MNTPGSSRLKKWSKRIAFITVALVTVLALAYAIESYRARRLWQHYRAELEAKGEVFDFRRLIPPAIPDDQNFFMTPLLRPFSDYVVDEQSGAVRLRDPAAGERVTAMFAWTSKLRSTNPGWRMGQFKDLAAWQQQLRDTNGLVSGSAGRETGSTGKVEGVKAPVESASSPVPALQALAARPIGKPAEDLLFLLSLNQAELDEIRTAARRPGANLKARYDDGVRLLLPQMAMVKTLAQPLSYSALACLAQNDPAAAARDLQANLKIAESLTGEPLLIVGLVHIAIRDLALQALWEGLARHQWREAELAEFETILKRANIVEFMRRCLRGEQAFSVSLLSGAALAEEIGGKKVQDPALRAYASLPAPLRYHSQRLIVRLGQEQVLPAFDAAAGTVDLARLDEKVLTAKLGGRNPFTALALGTVSAVRAASRNAAKAQANVNLARVAVAIERYRLTAGALPQQLGDLAPRFLDPVPPDPVNGQPLRYRRGEGDLFTLYSVGMNGQDDSGAVATSSKPSPTAEAAAGDWVWQNHPVTNTVAASE
jgi:hypothetical protein